MARWEAALIIAIGLGVGLAIAATALLPLSHALTGGLRPHVPAGPLAAILGGLGAAGAGRAGAADAACAARAAGRGDRRPRVSRAASPRPNEPGRETCWIWSQYLDHNPATASFVGQLYKQETIRSCSGRWAT